MDVYFNLRRSHSLNSRLYLPNIFIITMANILAERTSSKTVSIVSFIALLIFLPLLLLAAYQTVTLMSRAAGIQANIVVDTKATLEPLTTDWFHTFAQGGEEQTDMLAPVAGQVRALSPKRIRIDHIYDSYNVVGRSGANLTFDFSRLDKVLDTISSVGAKPVIALSYMPGVIARDGSIINPPNDWNEWATVVQKTIEHISGSRGTSDVYYEVWNEPDIAQFGGWSLTGDKNYLTLYHYASVGANNAGGVTRFYLGGPATTGLYKNWVLSLITSGNRVNFLSWHTYQYNQHKFDDDQRNIISWLLPYPNFTLIPKLITEFGFTGDKSSLYGSTFAAAHTAAVVRQLIAENPTFLFSFELKDGPKDESSGWGLITHESKGNAAKPRYYVFNFLDTMAGNRLSLKGEGTWVTGFASANKGAIRVMLVNYDSSGAHVENTPVTFDNLDPGNYTYREHFLFGRDITLTQVVTGNSFQKQIYMPAQSVAILEITKQ